MKIEFLSNIRPLALLVMVFLVGFVGWIMSLDVSDIFTFFIKLILVMIFLQGTDIKVTKD